VSRLVFFVKEALRALRRNAAPSAAATVTIAITVLLVGVLIPVIIAAHGKTADVRDQLSTKVFLFPGPTTEQVDSLERKISAIDHIESVDFVSKSEALQITKERLDDDDILKELPGNPLPPSFTVVPDDPDNLESIQLALAPPNGAGDPEPISPLIEEVSDSREETGPIREVTGALEVWLGIVAALLLVASLMLVANTIRLSIYARRRDIEVMQLVGATRWFIRWPFVIEGLVVGLIGAAFAIGLLWMGKATVGSSLTDNFGFISDLRSIGFAPLVAILVLGSMVVAALGSGITLRRFLRV
jgi:cell division transport system permease protein